MASEDRERKKLALLAELTEARGEYLTPDQVKLIQWIREERRKATIEEILLAMPKGLYCQLAGVSQHKVDAHAGKFNLPLKGKTLDMYQVIKGFHDFIASNMKTLTAADDIRDLNREKIQQQVDEARRRAELSELEIQEKKNQVVPRAEVRAKLAWLTGKFRKLGERLGKSHGPDAQLAVNEFIDDISEEIRYGNLDFSGEK
jgi:hypothetical protein